MGPGELASGTSGQGLRTSRINLTLHQCFPSLTSMFSILEGHHVLFQVPDPSQRWHCLGPGSHRLPHHLCLAVRQPFLSIHPEFDKQICMCTQTEDGQIFSKGSSICTTTLSATPSAMLRSAGDIQIIRVIEAKLLMHCKAKLMMHRKAKQSLWCTAGTSSTPSSSSSPSSPPPPTSAAGNLPSQANHSTLQMPPSMSSGL